MGMIFRFRALSDENESFVRDYELRYDSDLLDFHLALCDDLGFEPREMASFFLSGNGWEKGAEFTSVDMGGGEDAPLPMEGTLLGTIVRTERARLIYMFDQLSGRSLFLELAGTFKENPDTTYPRVAFSAGEAPPQFDLEALVEDRGSIFDEALGEFGSFEGDDFYDEEY